MVLTAKVLPDLSYSPEKVACEWCGKEFTPRPDLIAIELYRVPNPSDPNIEKFKDHPAYVPSLYRVHEHPDVCSPKCRRELVKNGKEGWCRMSSVAHWAQDIGCRCEFKRSSDPSPFRPGQVHERGDVRWDEVRQKTRRPKHPRRKRGPVP